ncbi:hypothetical protein DFS34DRAFT_579715 [Phlyctochytrium arcticum]|nr:hypothetical protein DFS34DRAFT_579715 [Phlyctochytrium arcticum]
MFKPGAESNGLLDTIEPRFFVDVNIAALSIASIEQVPFFEVSAPGGSSRDLDQKLGAALRTAIKRLAQVDKSAILGGSRSTEAQIAFLSDVNAAIKDLPYGTIYFNKLNHATKDYTITLGFGLDARLDNTPSFPPAGRRQSIQLSQLTNAILRKSSAANSQSVITQGLRLFPEIKSGGVQIQISGPIGRILYPFGLSFLLPIFTIILVREKEDRILMMMRMNGLKPGVYALSQFITFYILYLISATLFVVAGYIVRLDVFVRTDIAVLVLVLVVWGLAQVAMAFFFASFLNKSSNALLIAFLVVLCGIIISLAMNQILVEPLPIIFLWPPFAFYRILTLVNEASFLSTQRPYTFGQLRPGDEVFTAIISMLGMAVLLFAIASYVDGVAPGEFGVKRRWHWPISQFFASSRKAPAAGTTKTKGKSGKGVALDKTDTWDSEELNSQDYDPMEDADVRIERHRVLSGSYDPSTHPLVIKSIHKSYPPRHGMKAPKVAVRDITLALETSQVFGLLGPNGAGKTSLLSLLTGLYAPTSGTATVAGQDIRTDIDGVYRSIGVCPQFDLLWSDLTVSDHLYFYARLKGIPPKDEAKAVLAAMEQVKLAPFADRQVVGLSGGERRRLSIAIALVGSPALVFLDEPTTGLDPEVRRLIWDIIDSARRAGRTIVLTTHSMEEAEVCCQRIGIMCKGSLRCVGPQLRLKQVYGSGFKMHATAKTLKDVRRVRRFVEKQVMPAACALMPTPTPGNGTLTPYSNKSSYFPPYYPTTAPSSLAPTSPGSGHHHHLPSTTPNSAWTVETLPHPADSKKPWRRLDAFNTTLIYTFNPTPQDFYLDPNDVPNVDPGSVASVFENMNHQMGLSARNDPSAIGLEDWGVTQSGLDDVFLKVIVGDKEDTDDLDEEADGAGAS